jgi:uncharacterized protein (DUF1330 family)
MNGGPKEINAELIAGLRDDVPVVMVNLVRYRDRAEYKRYSELAMPLIKQRGGTVLWAGDAEGVAFGAPGENRWDYVVLVRYPSRAAFLDMMASPEYAIANAHRERGLEKHVIIATSESYSKFKP